MRSASRWQRARRTHSAVVTSLAEHGVRTRVVAVVNVRMGSTRLPGKALLPICGKPLLDHLLDRLGRARTLDSVVVATSTRNIDDAIAIHCSRRGVHCFRGSEEDVLSRTLGALKSADAQVGVVVFGDGPLIDPAIVDRLVETYRRADPPCDFVSNDLLTTYPPGMEVEVFAVAALADADAQCADARIREHGTLYVRRAPGRYKLLNVEAPAHLRRPELELEVDTPIDVEVIEAIVRNFDGRADFTLEEIIAFMDLRPDIAETNRSVPRRWKVFRSCD